MHDALLVAHSRFFQAACTGRFRESVEHIVRLPEEEPEDFETFLLWLYTQSLEHVESPDVNQHYEALFKQYFLADRLQMRSLRNAVVEAVIELEHASDFVPSTDLVNATFERTAPTSPLRRLVVDMHVADVRDSFIEEHEAEFCREFLLGLALSCMRQLPSDERTSRMRAPHAHRKRYLELPDELVKL